MQDDVITVEMLTKAIMNSNKDIDEKEARNIAEHVMNFFGYEDRIIDNYLDNDDRSVLYFLQDMGIVTSNSEEVYLRNGRKTWRIFYWVLNTKKMKNLK